MNEHADSKDPEHTKAGEGLPSPLVAQALEKSQIAKYHTKGGHGFSAEDANNLSDKIRGKRAEVVGVSNELNGADRVVNGLRVQSKYFQTPTKTVAASFDSSTGVFRYTGQVLEVPSDQYDACVKIMRDRISQGRVPGYSNPADADKIVHQGTVTYKQARNIARSGNLDSLSFDAKTHAVTSTGVMAVSFAASYAQSRWQGNGTRVAIGNALHTAIAAGSTTLITGIVSAQVLRTGVAAIGVVPIRNSLKVVSRTALGKEAINRLAAGSLGKAAYGAAATNHVSKLLRSNAVTATVAAVATSTPDFYRVLFARSISWQQFAKNTSVNVAGVAGGTVGWMGGALAGGTIGSTVPVVGTAVGGVVGGIIGALSGGVGGSAVAKRVADRVRSDDADYQIAMIQEELRELAFEYMLTESEVERIGVDAKGIVSPRWLREAFKSSKAGADSEALTAWVREEFEPRFETLVGERPKIQMPEVAEVESELSRIVEAVVAAPTGQED